MVNWQYFPKNQRPSETLLSTIEVFKSNHSKIDSKNNGFSSNEVLEALRTDLELLGYQVERGKKHEEKISVPVLFGVNGSIEKFFDADGYHEKERIVMEVEAGRAVANNQFLKDLFQALVMVNVEYLVIAIRNRYGIKNDFEYVRAFIETLYVSTRFSPSLKGILLIGY